MKNFLKEFWPIIGLAVLFVLFILMVISATGCGAKPTTPCNGPSTIINHGITVVNGGNC